MKKALIFAVLFLIIVFSIRITNAKVLSEDYLQNVTQVTLKNGVLFKLCELKPITSPSIQDSKEVNTSPENPPPMLDPNSQSNSEPCDLSQNLILADLEYTYVDGSKAYVDRLFVFDNNLYRPSGGSFEYYSDSNDQLSSQKLEDLLLTDPNLPNGQKNTGGFITIHYKQETPKELMMPSGGETMSFKAGEIDGLVMKLDEREYSSNNIEKEVSDVVLLNIQRPILTSTPTLEISPTGKIISSINTDMTSNSSWKTYINNTFHFSIQYPNTITKYEDNSSEDGQIIQVIFYKNTATEPEYRLTKNSGIDGGGPVKILTINENTVDEKYEATLKAFLFCPENTPLDELVECTDKLSYDQYGSSFIIADFTMQNDQWQLVGPSWTKGERDMTQEIDQLTEMLKSFHFIN